MEMVAGQTVSAPLPGKVSEARAELPPATAAVEIPQAAWTRDLKQSSLREIHEPRS